MTATKQWPVALTIAGSDSGGGAGIQADLKTFAALGVHGTSAITCLTAQNPERVLGIEPCPPKMLRQQIEAVFEGFNPAAVKTGMLFSAENVSIVASFFKNSKLKTQPSKLIVDPVMVSTSGTPLLKPAAVKKLREELLPLALLVTPNLSEAGILTGHTISSVEAMRRAARQIHSQSGCAVLVKGGHLRNSREALDIFFDGQTELLLSAPFVKGRRTHGTGCTYSAAICAALVLGHDLPQAVQIAKNLITGAIAHNYRAGNHFVLNHFPPRENGPRNLPGKYLVVTQFRFSPAPPLAMREMAGVWRHLIFKYLPLTPALPVGRGEGVRRELRHHQIFGFLAGQPLLTSREPSFRPPRTRMKKRFRPTPIGCFFLATILYMAGCAAPQWKAYQGKPYHDSVYHGGPQKIPGRVQCAYYDLGGEGVAYHDTDAVNNGSGRLNPANGTYLNEFRMNEGVDTSYTKYHDQIDNSPYDRVQPPEGQLYVGWTVPGEWFNLTVMVEHAGVYTADLLYTSNRGGTISLDCNGRPCAAAINIISTRDDRDPIAWRQWHHWNVISNLTEVTLPRGKSVLTVHIVTGGNMNLAWLDFRPKP